MITDLKFRWGAAAVLVVSCAVLGISPPGVAAATTPAAASVALPAGYTAVDLRAVVNMGFKDEFAGDGRGGWTDQGGNDMRFIPVGHQTFRGIPFEIIDPKTHHGRASLILYGAARPYFPVTAEVTGIAKKARSIYFLHGAAWCQKEQGATYTVTYADGTAVDIPIRGGHEIADWWQPQDGEACRVAWFGPNMASPNVGLLVFPWQNPNPDKVIAAIRFTSAKIATIPCLAAVTLSDQDARLPDSGFNSITTGAATLGAGMVGEVKPEDKLPPLVVAQPSDDLQEGNAYLAAELKSAYWPNILEQLNTGGVADMSFLNDKPAGQHGRLKVKAGRLAWADGSPARFFATNTTYSIMLPATQEEARRNAKWLAANGINLVRIHHWAHSGSSGSIFDFWEGKPRPPGLPKGYAHPYLGNTRHYDAESWDKLDLYLAALKEQGIYVHLSLLVFPWFGRIEAAAGDIPPARWGWSAYRTEGAQMFVSDYIDKLNVYIKDVFAHKNPHTSMTYAEDPVFTSVELVNEDSLFFVGNDPNRLTGYCYLELHEQFNNWLLAKYGSAAKLREAWGDGVIEDWETLIKDLNFMKRGRTPPPVTRWTEAPQGFTPVDLAAAVNTSYVDTFKDDGKGGWFDEGRESDMRFFTPGKLLLLDVPFAVSAKGGVIVADVSVKGGDKQDQPNPKAADPWPKRVEIPVAGKARSLYFLHTAGWMPGNGEPFAFYDVLYADGSTQAIGLRNAIEVSDWSGPTNGLASRMGWTGMSLGDRQIGLNVFAWDNPSPDKAITKIIARLEGNRALLALLGLTLSQAPAKLPRIADLPPLADWQRFVRLWEYSRFAPQGWTPEMLRRASDQIKFLGEAQTQYFLSQKKFIEGLGFKGLFLGSNWWCPPLMTPANLYTNAQLDLTDAHNYGGSVGLMRAPGGGTMATGPQRVLNKPFMLSEWNPGAKEEYRLCALPLISLYGQCLNGWELPMQFGCSRVGWSFYKYYWDFCINYPSDLAQYPAMALAVRRGDLQEGPIVFKQMVAEAEIFAEALAPKHDYKDEYFAIGKVGTEYCGQPAPDVLAKAVVETAWDKQAAVITSATGELVWDYGRGIVTCRAPRTQGAVGFLPRTPTLALPAADLSVTTPFAAVWLSSLTNQPIAESTKILVTAVGRQSTMDRSQEKDKDPLYKPMIIEAVQGTIALKSARVETLKVYSVGYDGRPIKAVEATRSAGKLTFSFDTMAFKGPYLLITSEPVTLP